MANVEGSEQVRAVTALFDRVAADYDKAATRFFPFSADRLVRIVRPAPGSKALDIATGTGHAALALAQAVGPRGRVMGIDLSEAMLDVAAANFRRTGLGNVDLHVMNAQDLEFRRDYFDSAVCAYGIFFLPDMPAALRDWARVLKPGGTLAFSCFGPAAFQPMADLFFESLVACGVERPGGATRVNAERLHNSAACEALMRDAGLEDVRVETHALGYHLEDAKAWWEVVWGTGFRGLFEGIAPERQGEFHRRHLAAVQELATADGIWLNAESHYVVGRKPAA